MSTNTNTITAAAAYKAFFPGSAMPAALNGTRVDLTQVDLFLKRVRCYFRTHPKEYPCGYCEKQPSVEQRCRICCTGLCLKCKESDERFSFAEPGDPDPMSLDYVCERCEKEMIFYEDGPAETDDFACDSCRTHMSRFENPSFCSRECVCCKTCMTLGVKKEGKETCLLCEDSESDDDSASDDSDSGDDSDSDDDSRKRPACGKPDEKAAKRQRVE
jgi:hypothetical protein